MVKLSLSRLIKKRQKLRVVTAAASLVLLIVFGELIISKNPDWGKGAPQVDTGQTLIIDRNSFIWNGIWCPGAGTSFVKYSPTTNVQVLCNGEDITNTAASNFAGIAQRFSSGADLVIKGNIQVVVWGDLLVHNLQIKDGAVLTHAPLVWHDIPGNYYYHSADYNANPHIHDVYFYQDQMEQDFNYATGAIDTNPYALATQKKVNIVASGRVDITNGGKIDVTGKGYPGGAGNAHGWQYDKIVNDGGPGTDETTAYNTFGMGVPNGPNLYLYGGVRGQAGLDACDNGIGNYIAGAGGGGYSADGGSGSWRNYKGYPWNTCSSIDWAAAGKAYRNAGLNYGPGGGSALGWVSSFNTYSNFADPGGGGGGFINIQADTLSLTRTSLIAANGSQGANGGWSAGGGGGGVIQINVANYYVGANTTGDPDVSADHWNTTDPASAEYANDDRAGTYDTFPKNTLQNMAENGPGQRGSAGSYESHITNSNAGPMGNNIQARGGRGGRSVDGRLCRTSSTQAVGTGAPCAAGGGSGGRIVLYVTTSNHSCIISADTQATPPYIIPDYCGENDDVIIDGLKNVITQGPRKFKSLSIRNAGSLTHEAFSATDDAATSAKKVDITLIEDLNLETGSEINVSGKGFQPNGDYRCDGCGPSQQAGPGGGWNGYYYNDDNKPALGSGGGYGGQGGPGKGTGKPNEGPGVRVDSAPPTQVGSPGGNGNMEACDERACSPGGAGGGRVHIRARTIRTAAGTGIYADGNDGQGASFTGGGGGSGGSIWLELTDTATTNIAARATGGATGGEEGVVEYKSFSAAYINTYAVNVHANGGSQTRWGNGGGGGGGRILIERIDKPQVTIKKSLKALQRGSIDMVDGFNPYALQLNDVIRVTLEIRGLTPTATTEMRDTVLSTGGTGTGAKCAPPDNGYVYGPSDTEASGTSRNLQGDDVVWSFTPSVADLTVWYDCRVIPK